MTGPFGELPPRSGDRVVASIATALAPPLACARPPSWIRPAQAECFRRVAAAIERHRGALVAEPVGSGKTWIALAAAELLEGRAACVVPAAVRDQWLRVAAKARVQVTLTTHEQWSRAARRLGEGLVVIDESHRLRGERLRRVAHLAPQLVGRRGVLLSATPVVNRLADLIHPLLLLVRDDALAAHGIRSLATALRGGTAPPALAELIVSGSLGDLVRPRGAAMDLRSDRCMDACARRRLRQIDRLCLSPDPGVRGLLRGVLTLAAASGRDAFRAALDRYRALLQHHRDAQAAGRALTRAELRRFMTDDPDQLIMWSLFDGEGGTGDLACEDLQELDRLAARRRTEEGTTDPKVDRLRDLLQGGPPAIVFVGATATVHQLRRELRPLSRVAWCTGAEAGIGRGRLSRHRVLRWFGPNRPPDSPFAPFVLVTTDVAAEGLDLQHAGRVIHYDIPWTPARLAQREGRALRLGSVHTSVQLIRFSHPACIERRLGVHGALARKAGLPRLVGIGDGADAAWTWPRDAARCFGGVEPAAGLAVGAHGTLRILVGAELLAGPRSLARVALVLTRKGRWIDETGSLRSAMRAGVAAIPWRPSPAEALRLGRLVAAGLRPLLRHAAGMLWGLAPSGRTEGQAAKRLRRMAALAARRRESDALRTIGSGLAFLVRGHTLGEQALLAGLAELPDCAVLAALRTLPPESPVATPLVARLTGLVLFRRESRPPTTRGQKR